MFISSTHDGVQRQKNQEQRQTKIFIQRDLRVGQSITNQYGEGPGLETRWGDIEQSNGERGGDREPGTMGHQVGENFLELYIFIRGGGPMGQPVKYN